MAIAYIGLGSNLGDRRAMLTEATRRLGKVAGVAALYSTRAVGGPQGQPDFLNSAVGLDTDLDPEALLERLLSIEQALGRRRGELNGPRVIDLDLLLFGNAVVRSQKITIPHPRLQERGFVLAPLTDIVPDLIHPVLGSSIWELYRDWVERNTGDWVERISGPEWAEFAVDSQGVAR